MYVCMYVCMYIYTLKLHICKDKYTYISIYIYMYILYILYICIMLMYIRICHVWYIKYQLWSRKYIKVRSRYINGTYLGLFGGQGEGDFELFSKAVQKATLFHQVLW